MSIHTNYGMMQCMALAENVSPKRTAARQRRRRELIDATMKCIGRKGISGMTLSDVAKEAGLSQGIVNLHFKSKDNLLTETLKLLADEYRELFDRTLERSGPSPADKLLAVMEMDLKPSICSRAKLAVWFAFWGEVKSRPTYRKICDEADRHYDAAVEALCEDIIADGTYSDRDARTIATALTSFTNGLWLSCLVSPQDWDREHALASVRAHLAAVFPKHFPRENQT